MWPFRKPSTEWVGLFADALEAFGRSLPHDVVWSLERNRNGVEFAVEAPTPDHRSLSICAESSEIEYSLGSLWTEGLEPVPATLDSLLAACDALREGRVREVRDRKTGLLYHVYRLNSWGRREFVIDSQYAFRHVLDRLFGHRIRDVSIHRLPPLAAA